MQEQLSPVIGELEQALRQALGPSLDICFRPILTNLGGERHGFLLFIDGLAEGKKVEAIITGVTRYTHPPFEPPDQGHNPLELLRKAVLPLAEAKLERRLSACVEAVLFGQALLALDGFRQALLISTGWNPGRRVDQPSAEREVQGPRDGMVEYLPTNLILLRRRVADRRLRIQSIKIGRRSRTMVAITYLEGVANPEVVAEVRKRLEAVRVDAIQGANSLSEFIQDSPTTPFPTVMLTERPDRLAAAILEGRIGIVVDGTPFAIVVPITLFQLMQAPGDYYQHYMIGTAFRALRFLSLILSLTLPAVYVMLVTFHHEMIPTPLALSVAAGREGTPFPTLAEVFGMMTTFEIINEAGLRLPPVVGQTVSIVGALVIGQAAVQAGLVAPGTIIVVAAAGLAGFALPAYNLSLVIRLVRFGLLLLCGFVGALGFILGTSVLALHLASLRSFGTPYLAPIAPYRPSEQQDALKRSAWWRLRTRPDFGAGGSRRQPEGQKPAPPGGDQP